MLSHKVILCIEMNMFSYKNCYLGSDRIIVKKGNLFPILFSLSLSLSFFLVLVLVFFPYPFLVSRLRPGPGFTLCFFLSLSGSLVRKGESFIGLWTFGIVKVSMFACNFFRLFFFLFLPGT